MNPATFIAGILIGVAIAAAALAAAGVTQSPLPVARELPMVSQELADLSLDGFSAVEARVRRPFIVLVKQQNATCNLTLSAVTDELQLNSIEKALNGGVEARPNPHELMADALKRFGVAVDMVRIDRLDGTAYLASLILRKGQQLLSLDSRPSDAIAIALRANATTYIRDDLFEKNAKAECG